MADLPAGIAGWENLPFFAEDWPRVAARIREDQRAGKQVLPSNDLVFNALRRTAPEAARVVILGQDPYPTPGHAHGLAFSVRKGTKALPASLRNIFKELKDDLNVDRTEGCLEDWADQGVLLLNTSLTVIAGEPASHAKIGWTRLTDQMIARVAREPAPRAFVLWGRHAQAKRPLIESAGRDHLIIESAHPSPLSARRGFFGSKPFSRIDAHLAAPIRWG